MAIFAPECLVNLLNAVGGCGGPGPFYVMRPDGSNLRALWKNPEVMRFELSPDGKRALLWILEGGHKGNHPEPNRMAAVNIISVETKLFEKNMVALEPGCVADGKFTQSMQWAEDGSSVTLLVHSLPDRRDWRRVTLDLP